MTLPEQGGSNERLDAILIDYASKYFQILRTGGPRDLEEKHRTEAKSAIRTLVLEEMPKEMTKPPEDCKDDAYAIGIMAGWNSCLKEQRKKLGGRG